MDIGLTKHPRLGTRGHYHDADYMAEGSDATAHKGRNEAPHCCSGARSHQTPSGLVALETKELYIGKKHLDEAYSDAAHVKPLELHVRIAPKALDHAHCLRRS